jgi:hypothetical protein
MTASTGELHTASGKWLSNVFLALAKFAVRRPKTRWVYSICHKSPISPPSKIDVSPPPTFLKQKCITTPTRHSSYDIVM